MLAKAMQAFLKKAREPTYKKGGQSIKSLTKQGVSLSNIEITGDNIGSFKRTARKYNVDFAKSTSEAWRESKAFYNRNLSVGILTPSALNLK